MQPMPAAVTCRRGPGCDTLPHDERNPVIDENTGRRRVLLKLSGEAFGGGQLGVNPDVVGQMLTVEQVLQNAPDATDDRFKVTAILGEEQ